MKVLLINGSPNVKGNTGVALSEVANQLNKNGIDTEMVWIGNKPIRGCIACGKCHENGNGRCIFNDDITNEISALAEAADGIVIGSPVYYGQPAGPCMSLVQRMLFSNSAAIGGKPVANVAVCRRGGATMAFQTMNMPWMMVNSPIATSQYWNIAYGLAPGEAAHDGEGMQTMRTLADNLTHLVKSLDPAQRPQREPWTATNFMRQDLINSED